MFIPFTAKAVPWKWIGVALTALAIIAIVFFSIRAYGNAQFEAGEAKADAAWHAASEKLKAESAASAGDADVGAAAREIEFVERVALEKEKIDAANQEGSSPLDALFGSGGM